MIVICAWNPTVRELPFEYHMKVTTKSKRRGITWTLTNGLENTDFADDMLVIICRMSQSHNDMQQKTNDLNANHNQSHFQGSYSFELLKFHDFP